MTFVSIEGKFKLGINVDSIMSIYKRKFNHFFVDILLTDGSKYALNFNQDKTGRDAFFDKFLSDLVGRSVSPVYKTTAEMFERVTIGGDKDTPLFVGGSGDGQFYVYNDV